MGAESDLMKGKLIVIEGLDMSGKATQAALLSKKLKKDKKKVKVFHFPVYRSTLGGVIKEYLKGKFGKKEAISTETAALLYSADRYQFKEQINSLLKKGYFVICDRYIWSNLFQVAKAKKKERDALIKWLRCISSRLPKPDVTFYLVAPVSLISSNLKYKKPDINERDIGYQKRVKKLFSNMCKREKWIVIESAFKKGSAYHFRPKKEILGEIYKKLKEKLY